MKGSCGGAKPLLSQCPGKLWHLLYEVVVYSCVSTLRVEVSLKKNTV